MKQLFFILFLTLSFLIQSTIEAKSSKSIKKPLTTRLPIKKLPPKKPPSKKLPSKKSTTIKPTTKKPTTQKPTTKKPSTQKPTTQKPATQKPSTQKQLPSYVQCSTIKYYINNDFDSYYVKDTIENIQSETFLKFTKEKYPIRNVGINFYSNNKEDKVDLSYDDKKPTVVNLTEETYDNQALIKFYLGYALGLIPELARKDRDSNVKVFEDNISVSYKKYYDKKSSYPDTYYATGFDFGSVMLAKPSFGSKSNSERTYMSTFFPHYENQISEYNEFSFNDFKRLNLLYCKDICKKSKTCGNYGYYGNNCDSCECFYPFHGKDCTLYHERHSECGKDITIKAYSKAKEKKLKNISLGECFYIIKANNPKKKVKLTIKRFKGVPGIYKLEIKYRKDKGAEPLKINGDVTQLELPPLSSSVIIDFVSYGPGNELELKYQEV